MEEKLKELLTKMDGRVETATGKLKTEIEGLINDLKEASATSEVVKGLEERVAEMEVKAAKASKSIEKSTKGLGWSEAVTKALEENKEGLESLISGKRDSLKFELKAVANISSGNISGGDVPQAERFAGFDALPSRKVRLLSLMSSRSTSADKVEWVYQDAKEGSAGQTAEGATYNQIDFEWKVGNEEVKKTTAYIKVTDEMLAKGSIVSQEINNELLREVTKAVEKTAYDGDGTGTNLNGVVTQASAFSAATVGANTVDNANEVDVLTVAMAQIDIAQEGDASANAIMMHPADIAKLKLEKLSATDKRYVGRLMAAGQNLSLDGVPIVPSTLIAKGDYLIGDFAFAELVQREGMAIEIGYEGTDFKDGFRTIRCQWRGAVVVRHNRRSAFIAGDFATDQAALETT